MTKDDIIAECLVPADIKNDPHEPVTQEEYTQWLRNAVPKLGLTADELNDIKFGKTSHGEVRAILNIGRFD
jgi:hypothetical protein